MNVADHSILLEEKIRTALHQAEKIMIAAHTRPDGDAIGSLLGLGLALKAHGKQVQMVIQGGYPGKYKFLEGCDEIREKVELPFDFSIALDCADNTRAGEIFTNEAPSLNIDHHVTNTHFGNLNFVQPEYAATAAILADHLPKWGFPLTPSAANALLMGIVTDTIGFRTPNVNASLLQLCAELIGEGADLANVYKRALVDQSYASAILWGTALSRLQREGRLVWASITLDDRKNAQYSGWDDADLANFLSTIEDSDISVLFNQQKDDKVKVSWRSTGGIDVSELAVQFNGGGHPPAAGAELDGSLQAVQELVLQATKKILNEDERSQGEKNA